METPPGHGAGDKEKKDGLFGVLVIAVSVYLRLLSSLFGGLWRIDQWVYFRRGDWLITSFHRVHLVTTVKCSTVLAGGELRWVSGGHGGESRVGLV